MQRRENRFFAAMPSIFSILACVMFVGILLVLIVGERWLKPFYENKSLIKNSVLWLAALAGAGLLGLMAKRVKPSPIHERRSLWLTRLVFLCVLAMQFVIARACWYKMGWDISVAYTTAEELARGEMLSNPDYFKLCPNNAPLTMLQFIPMWVAVRIGLAVPFVVLPYIDAVLLNLSAYVLVRCVQTLTPNRVSRAFAMALAVCWIALSPYILYPYTDSFAILFPVLAFYAYLRINQPVVKAFVISLLCFFGASIKPTVLIVLIALAILSVCGFLARGDFSRRALLRALAVVAAVVVGMLPGRGFQNASTEYLAGSAVPEGQLSEMHYLMLGMNGETFGGHSPSDVEFSTSYESLSERRSANISRAWERLSGRSLAQNAHFFAVKTFKAYNDGSFASHSSFLELEVPRRADALSRFLRECYHHGGAYVPYFQTAAQGLWLMILMLCAMGCLQLRRRPEIAVLALTLLGVTAYLLLFEVWPRYLFLYAPFFAILASMAAEKSLCSKQ